MGNRIMTALAASGAAAALSLAPFSAGDASAQSTSNSQLSAGGLISNFSADDVGSMLADFQIETALTDYTGGPSATMLAATSGGARFIISLLACEDVAAANGCQRAVIFTAVSNAGFAYQDINDFNMSADVTKAINVAEQSIVIFSAPIYSGGGIGRENFKLLTALFLNDMQNFSDAQNSSAAEVSFGIAPKAGDKLTNLGGTPSSAATPLGIDATMIDEATSVAVANTWKVKFRTQELEDVLK